MLAVDTLQPERHRFTSMIPAHFSINEALYLDGVQFGSSMPERGAFLHVPGEEPTIGVLRNEQLSSTVHRRFVIITPATDNGLTLKSLLFPHTGTHGFRRNKAGETYRIQAGSVLLVGDAAYKMHFAVYCFHTPIHSSAIMRLSMHSLCVLMKG